jgi:hypothetical protein
MFGVKSFITPLVRGGLLFLLAFEACLVLIIGAP